MRLTARAFLLLALLPSWSAAGPPDAPELLAARLRSWGLQAELPFAYGIARSTEGIVGAARTEKVFAQGPEGRLIHAERIAGLDAAQGEGLIKDKLVLLQPIYDPDADAYYAAFSKQASCPEKKDASYRPLRRGKSVLHFLRLYSNEHLTYGACKDGKAFYRALMGMLYCPKTKSVFILEDFMPADKSNAADSKGVLSLSCR